MDHLDRAAERALMRRIADGDPAAFPEFTERYGDRLTTLCVRQTKDAETALDLRQEVLIKVWRHASAFDARSGLRTWLYQVVVRTAIDEHRRLARVPWPVEQVPETGFPAAPFEDVVVENEWIRWAMSRIPEPLRAVIVLSSICDLPDPRIARFCGIAPATVRTRLHRARPLLRRVLS